MIIVFVCITNFHKCHTKNKKGKFQLYYYISPLIHLQVYNTLNQITCNCNFKVSIPILKNIETNTTRCIEIATYTNIETHMLLFLISTKIIHDKYNSNNTCIERIKKIIKKKKE
jgi:hypothetical protein